MFEFVFQRGEFFYEDPPGMVGLLKDVLLPILMLILGYGLNVLHDHFKMRRKLRHLRLNVLLEVESLPRVLKEQAESFKSFSKEILKPNIQSFGVDVIHNLVDIQGKYDRFNPVELTEAAYMISAKKNHVEVRKRIHNMLEGIRFIDKIMQGSEQLKLNGLNEINTLKRQTNSVIRNIGEEIRTYPTLHNEGLSDPYLKEAVGVYNQHLENQHLSSGLMFGKSTLIDPLSALAEKSANNSESARKMLKPLYECQSIYRNIEVQRTFLSKTYETYAEGLLGVIDGMNAATEVLSKNGNLYG